MKLWQKILMFPVQRRRADADLVPDVAKVIEVDLKEVPAIAALELQESLSLRLAQECFRRAADNDAEGVPRWGVVFDLGGSIGEEAARLCRGEDVADPGLARILEFNGIQLPKKGPNQSPQTTRAFGPHV